MSDEGAADLQPSTDHAEQIAALENALTTAILQRNAARDEIVHLSVENAALRKEHTKLKDWLSQEPILTCCRPTSSNGVSTGPCARWPDHGGDCQPAGNGHDGTMHSSDIRLDLPVVKQRAEAENDCDAGRIAADECHRTAADWNARYPIGTPIKLLEKDGSITKTRTRGIAWSLGDGISAIKVVGRPDGYLLDRIVPDDDRHEPAYDDLLRFVERCAEVEDRDGWQERLFRRARELLRAKPSA